MRGTERGARGAEGTERGLNQFGAFTLEYPVDRRDSVPPPCNQMQSASWALPNIDTFELTYHRVVTFTSKVCNEYGLQKKRKHQQNNAESRR
ncbi:hypothetical protein DMN91_008867 [Ooceraea biroi]|uniref:Uncharacterized protein n=1 Tax=Ooceraea biroi TaxID=2015173 RepID=A0A3L8DDF4_OOCBI|nr:hypothetical protein DMN91_008867 [Ooceraea biroi]